MRHRLLLAAAALAVLSVPFVARADGQPPGAQQVAIADPTNDPTVARLLGAKGTMKWNFAGQDGRYGHAEALVDAPADKVAQMALDFGHYRELHKKFATARVVGKEGQQTDVYMRYPVQIGPVRFEFWEVMRFQPAKAVGDTRVIEAFGIKGDMRQGHTIITVKPVGPTHALLQVDVLLVPKVPAPQSMIDEELRDGANDFVDGLRHRAQGWVGPVTTL